MRIIFLAVLALALVGCGDDASRDKAGEPYIPDNGIYEFGVDIGRLGDECLGSEELGSIIDEPVDHDFMDGPITLEVDPQAYRVCDMKESACDDLLLGDGGLVYRQTLTGLAVFISAFGGVYDQSVSIDNGTLEIDGQAVEDYGGSRNEVKFRFPRSDVDYSQLMQVTANGVGAGEVFVAMTSRFDYIKPECL